MTCTADFLFGGDHRWPVIGASCASILTATTARAEDSGVSVGFGDSQTFSMVKLGAGNAKQAANIRRVIQVSGDPGARHGEARETLLIKGPERVAVGEIPQG